MWSRKPHRRRSPRLRQRHRGVRSQAPPLRQAKRRPYRAERPDQRPERLGLPNDAGYITSTEDLGVDALADVTITNPENGQTLIYRNDEWVNEFGPPATSRSAPSATLMLPILSQVLTQVFDVDNMGVLSWTALNWATGLLLS